MKSKTVYLVAGSAGQYSDSVEWDVAAYLNRKQAERHLELVRSEQERLGEWIRRRDDAGQYDVSAPPNVYDSARMVEYGAEYCVVEIPLLASAPSRRRPAKLPKIEEVKR